MTVVVTGRVVIAHSVAAFVAGVVHVRLEDVSYADAAAPLVAETVLSGVSHDPDRPDARTTVVPFRIAASGTIDPEHDYSVRVWLDRDGDGQPGGGDIWSDQAYPVLTRGFGAEVTVVLGKE